MSNDKEISSLLIILDIQSLLWRIHARWATGCLEGGQSWENEGGVGIEQMGEYEVLEGLGRTSEKKGGVSDGDMPRAVGGERMAGDLKGDYSTKPG